jgi:hypothetical protein
VAKARAELYAAIHKPQGIKGNPMSRQTITGMTGLDKVQQRRYEILAKVKRTLCYGVFNIHNSTGNTIEPEKQEIFSRSKGFREINKRLGNIYHSTH